MSEEDHERIAEIARRLYEEEGRPENRAQEHWLRAEAIFRRQQQETQAPPPPEDLGEDVR